jgi:hypothetical protein
MKRKAIILIAVLYIVVGAAGAGYCAETYNYKDFTLPPLPLWTDKYADSNKGDMSYFMMSRLVEKLELSWLQAVELQNHFRDLTADGKKSQAAFDEALKRVRANRFQCRIDPAKLASTPFIVAIDMDETLLQQYYGMWTKGSQYYDYKITFPDGSVRGVSMAPGWQTLLETIKRLGGMVILFSANTDDVVWTIADTVTIHGEKLSQYVDGVMTNNYLILQGKYEWMPKGKAGNPVVTPSKDLRFLDKGLSKVIIIDDNPKRIIQNVCLRLPKKYEADPYYKDNLAVSAFSKQLAAIASEIAGSAAYAKEKGVSFGQAYLPYTQLGDVALDWLMDKKSFNRPQAIEYIRQHPDFVDRKF